MNQVIISPKEGVKLLLVAVPKTIDKPKLFDHHGYFRIGFNFDKDSHETWREIGTELAKHQYKLSIIGLASEITEEQAKELVNKAEKWEPLERYKSKSFAHYTALDALKMIIDEAFFDKKITLTSDQDCLILKVE